MLLLVVVGVVAAVVVGVAVVRAASSSGRHFESFTWSPNGMDYVRVCRDGPAGSDCKHFSRLICGSDHLAAAAWTNATAPPPSRDEVFAVLDEAMNRGINFFDSSPIYVGGVEYLIGQWRASREAAGMQKGKNPDDALYFLSKAGFPFDLFWSKSLPAGTHSAALVRELRAMGVLTATKPNPDGSWPL